jgi:sulfate adenylyltransferase subunit 2
VDVEFRRELPELVLEGLEDALVVVDEVSTTRLTERGATRADDRFSEAAMEDRKREGYF